MKWAWVSAWIEAWDTKEERPELGPKLEVSGAQKKEH